MINKFKLILITLVALVIISCGNQENTVRAIEQETIGKDSDITIQYLFTKDGCKVYRFIIEGTYRWVYWTNCQGNIESSKWNPSTKTEEKTQSITNVKIDSLK